MSQEVVNREDQQNGVYRSGATEKPISKTYYRSDGTVTDQNGNDIWALISETDGRKYYYVLMAGSEPKHKHNIGFSRTEKFEFCSNEAFLTYIEYLKEGSELSYKRAKSLIQLKG